MNSMNGSLAAHVTEPPPSFADHDRMLRMIMGFGVTQLVHAVAHFSIADELAKGPATAAEIAVRCGTDADATFRLLRACASFGLVVADSRLRFEATGLLHTLRRDVPGSLRGFAIAQASPGHWLPWGSFVESVRTGAPQTIKALGRELFDYYAQNPKESAQFTEAMDGMSGVVAKEIAQIVDTRSASIVADIGGAGGVLLRALLEANPHLNGILFDLPQIAANSPMASRLLELRGRLHIEGGDFFSFIPPADLYLLKYILHDWDGASCIRILKNCRRSLRSGGRIVVIEQHLGEANDAAIGPLFDVFMLVMTKGRERTLAEYEALYAAAGLRLDKTTATRSGMVVMELLPGDPLFHADAAKGLDGSLRPADRASS